MLGLTPQQETALRKLALDLPYYSKHALKIVDKTANLIPLVLNRAQMYAHQQLEKQRNATGMVRAIFLKGRQQGMTTYIQARYFHKTNFKSNVSAFVLAHHADSTLKIFNMTQKFHENLPNQIQQNLEKDTERAMIMCNGSSYAVGTAGSAQIGRGSTVQLFHGSEVGFYENADQLSTGLLQAVADLPGTELIFESTANGPGNFFYKQVMQAIAGRGSFQLIFVPWYWQPEYSDPLTEIQRKDLTEEEIKYYDNYRADGLTLAHLAWRRRKIEDFGGEEYKWKFLQEYPFNPEEAFVKAEGRFFDLPKVYAARNRVVPVDPSWPLVIGIDQGRTGDPTVISRRTGKVLYPFEVIPADDGFQRDMRLAGRAARIIEIEKPDLVVFDTTNEHGALDRLHELGYSRRLVKGVHFGERAIDPARHRNIRVQMYVDVREWYKDEVQIPGDQQYISELGAIPFEKETSNNVMALESKDKIIADLGWSPNKIDAHALTHAFPVRRKRVSGPTVSGSVLQAEGNLKTKFKSVSATKR